MAAINEFLKENVPRVAKTVGAAGIGNILFLPGYIKQLTEADNKMKALVKITGDWLLWTLKVLAPLRTFFISGLIVKSFHDIGAAIKQLVRDSGSLAAALDKVRQMQMSAQQFAPFVGGLAAAKQRVAELATLSARGPFKFEDLAEASHTLEVFTRGAYSSARATQVIGMAAVQSGSQITDVASAVGEFYDRLRAGQPIESAVEQLRQMGIISQHSADELVRLSHSGATSIEVFTRLTTTLEDSTKGFDDVSKSIQTVTAEHEKAAQALKVAFGAPWTEAEVQTTQNMTVVMTAVTPAVLKLSQGFALLFNSFSTVGSGILRLITSIPGAKKVFEGLAVGVNAAMLAILAFATVGLASLIPVVGSVATTIGASLGGALVKLGVQFTTATSIATGFARTMQVLGGLTLGVGIIAGAVMLTGALINIVHSARETQREAERANLAFDKTTQSIKDQIAAAQTLAERQEALAKGYNLVTEAQANLIQKQKEGRTTAQSLIRIWEMLGEIGETTPTKKKEPPQITLAKEQARKAKEEFLNRPPTESFVGLMTPERERLMQQERERRRATEQREFEERRAGIERRIERAGEPGRPRIREELIGVQEERAGTLLERARSGRASAEARDRIANINAQSAEELKRDQTRQDLAKQKLDDLHVKELTGLTAKEKVEQAQIKANYATRAKHIDDLQAKMARTRETGGGRPGAEETSVVIEARAELLRHGIEAGIIEERLSKTKSKSDRDALETETKLSNGLIVRGKIERDNQRLAVQALTNKAQEAKYNEENNVALEEGGKALQEQNRQQRMIQEQEKDQWKITKARVGAEYQIAQLRGTGAQKRVAEINAEIKSVLAQQRVEMERHGGPRIEQMAALKARVDALKGEKQEFAEQLSTARQLSDIDLKRRQAATSGRSQEAISLKDQEEFIQRFQQHRQEGMSDLESQQRATAETAQTITEQATRGGGLPVVASQLARIGGGGGVYAPGGDPNTMILRRIQTLNEASKTYLQTISEAAKKGGGID